VLILRMNDSPVTPNSDLLASSVMKGSEGASEENVVRVLCILMWYIGLHLYLLERAIDTWQIQVPASIKSSLILYIKMLFSRTFAKGLLK
jgi:hypothetical protein